MLLVGWARPGHAAKPPAPALQRMPPPANLSPANLQHTHRAPILATPTIPTQRTVRCQSISHTSPQTDPSNPALPNPTQPSPTLTNPTLPYPTLPSPTPTLPNPTQPYPNPTQPDLNPTRHATPRPIAPHCLPPCLRTLALSRLAPAHLSQVHCGEVLVGCVALQRQLVVGGQAQAPLVAGDGRLRLLQGKKGWCGGMVGWLAGWIMVAVEEGVSSL